VVDDALQPGELIWIRFRQRRPHATDRLVARPGPRLHQGQRFVSQRRQRQVPLAHDHDQDEVAAHHDPVERLHPAELTESAAIGPAARFVGGPFCTSPLGVAN
jgi:hypothetical protein